MKKQKQIRYKKWEVEMTPMAAPRMVHSDKWKKRPVVQRYKAWRDELRLVHKVVFPEKVVGIDLQFHIPFPKSWSIAKREEHRYKHHRQKPDLDNLVKAVMDATYRKDETISEINAVKKWWGLDETGRMIIEIFYEET